ncbi:MAG: ABC-F family ATP-binding cassette domain-containing protein [Patescibacteria group bacterium]|nr:ABC-F family ATP-binding cassette domain-containing protein [Patescibacteria group bacterium]
MAKNEKFAKPDFGGETIIRFDEVSFEFGHNKPILDEVSFTVRRGTKITLMGQNGAGKSTIFGLIIAAGGAIHKGEGHKPESGEIFVGNNTTIATARQVIPRGDLELTVRDFFQKCFKEKQYDIDPRIDRILDVVNLHTHKTAEDIKDRVIKTFSGGQQARLLLASALIQDPDILLLDEPTNNLDKAGIEHLTQFLIDYKKTCLVISHDADFLNSFTHGVLYLDVHTRKVEQYVGDYKDVVEQISARIEKENMANARRAKEIQENKDQANAFAMKGGQMRLVAKRMREKAEQLEEEMVDVRKEDKTIKQFHIPAQTDLVGDIVTIKSYSMISPKTGKPVKRTCDIRLRKKTHMIISGPNGVGKSTLLESIMASFENKTSTDIAIADGVRVGYYRQDFSMMDFNDTVYESLEKIILSVRGRLVETELRAVAASFLIGADAIHTRIGSLSEGQKGLVAFARLVLLHPGLLILDEPTNHINFRHLPVIAKALDAYEGAMIIVSHVPEFVAQIRIDETLEMK